MTRLLTDVEAAAARHMTLDDFHADLDAGHLPAPSRFMKDPVTGELSGYWASDDTPPSDLSARERRIEVLLGELRWWLLRHGNLVIPTNAVSRPVASKNTPYRIGMRVADLRTSYRLGRLSAEDIARFEALPLWGWDHKDIVWKARFDRIIHTWPVLSDSDRAWLNNQRRRTSALRPTWRAMLDARPELSQPQAHSQVAKFFAAAQLWLSRNPGRSMYSCGYRDTVEIDGQVYPLGRRVIYYRRRWAGLEGRNPMTTADVAMIERLRGWSWESSPQHVRAAAKRADLQHLSHLRDRLSA